MPGLFRLSQGEVAMLLVAEAKKKKDVFEKSKQEKDKMYAEILDGSLEYKGTALEDLIPHIAYTDFGKFFKSGTTMPALKDYLSREKTTLRAIDMGVVTFLAWVDFFVNENENDASILKSGGTVSRAEVLAKTGYYRHRDQHEKLWRKFQEEKQRGEKFAEMEACDYKLENYNDYVRMAMDNYNNFEEFSLSPELRRARSRQFVMMHKVYADIANRLCKPRDGDEKIILLFGNGGKGGFKNARGLRGSYSRIFDLCLQKNNVVCIWCDEHRTSQRMYTDGSVAIHPVKMRLDRMRLPRGKKKCNAGNHVPSSSDCRCFCSCKGCDEERTIFSRCDYHYSQKPFLNNGVSVDSSGKSFSRDLAAAVNIGMLFIARILKIQDVGPWGRFFIEDDEGPKGWRDIFRAASAKKIQRIWRNKMSQLKARRPPF